MVDMGCGYGAGQGGEMIEDEESLRPRRVERPLLEVIAQKEGARGVADSFFRSP